MSHAWLQTSPSLFKKGKKRPIQVNFKFQPQYLKLYSSIDCHIFLVFLAMICRFKISPLPNIKLKQENKKKPQYLMDKNGCQPGFEWLYYPHFKTKHLWIVSKTHLLLFGYLVIGDICMRAFSQSAWISHDCEVHTLWKWDYIYRMHKIIIESVKNIYVEWKKFKIKLLSNSIKIWRK